MDTLQDKVQLSKERLTWVREKHSSKKIAVAWTGGKDSTVVLDLWRRVLQFAGEGSSTRERFPLALTIDTGLKFPEIVRFRQDLANKWGLDLKVKGHFFDLESYPIARDPVRCCQDLKIKPLQSAIQELDIQVLLTGLRKDEHHSRAKREWLEKRLDPAYLQVNPIVHWTEMDVWAYIQSAGLPYCPLYDQGYRSLGCMPCTRPSKGDERSGRNQEKEYSLSLLHSLGYF